MNDASGTGEKDRGMETWAWRLLLATVFGVAFSIALGQTLGGLCLIAGAVAALRRRLRLAGSPLFWPALAFSGIALISIHLGPEPTAALKKSGRLVWFLLIPLTASLATSPARRAALLRAFSWGAGVLALKTLLLHPWKAWIRVKADGGLEASFMDHLVELGSMTAGQVLMMGLLVTLSLWAYTDRSRRAQTGWWALLAAQAAALVLHFKRGSWFVALLLIGAWLLARRRWTWLAVLLGGILLAICCDPVRGRVEQLSREWNVRGGGRLTMWVRIMPALVRDHPLGVGYRSVTPAMLRRVAPYVERRRNHLHSNPAQVLVETGWLGLMVYALWMLRAAVEARRRLRAAPEESMEHGQALALAWMLAGLLLNGLVEYNFGDTELMMLLAVVLGALDSENGREAPAS